MSRNGDFGPSACLLIFSIVLAMAPGAWAQSNYKTLHRFSFPDGVAPYGSVVFDHAGNLYSTTWYGGDSDRGTVFRLTPSASGRWKKETIYSFKGGSDGAFPFAGLIFDKAGHLYGTAREGGGTQDAGVVFELSPNAGGTWSERILYSFCAQKNCRDGSTPDARLTFDPAGNLYGTTYYGGHLIQCCGVVFKLKPNADGSWKESVLHSFCALMYCPDGANPYAGVTLDAAGNLYGTAANGGAHGGRDYTYKYGVVFKLTPNQDGSWTESVLHSFCSLANCRDGWQPDGGVIIDSAGDLYGTTWEGGDFSCDVANIGCGVVYKLTRTTNGSWKEKVVHTFEKKDGAHPIAGLIFDRAGILYGTTSGGGNFLSRCGAFGCGTVFKLAPNSKSGWSETVLHDFFNAPGFCPFGDLAFDTAGLLYGTTLGDEATSLGSVFQVTP